MTPTRYGVRRPCLHKIIDIPCHECLLEAEREKVRELEAKLVVRELTADLILKAILPKWKDPYTYNGDSRSDTEYRHGWNDCRAAVLAALAKEGMS